MFASDYDIEVYRAPGWVADGDDFEPSVEPIRESVAARGRAFATEPVGRIMVMRNAASTFVNDFVTKTNDQVFGSMEDKDGRRVAFGHAEQYDEAGNLYVGFVGQIDVMPSGNVKLSIANDLMSNTVQHSDLRRNNPFIGEDAVYSLPESFDIACEQARELKELNPQRVDRGREWYHQRANPTSVRDAIVTIIRDLNFIGYESSAVRRKGIDQTKVAYQVMDGSLEARNAFDEQYLDHAKGLVRDTFNRYDVDEVLDGMIDSHEFDGTQTEGWLKAFKDAHTQLVADGREPERYVKMLASEAPEWTCGYAMPKGFRFAEITLAEGERNRMRLYAPDGMTTYFEYRTSIPAGAYSIYPDGADVYKWAGGECATTEGLRELLRDEVVPYMTKDWPEELATREVYPFTNRAYANFGADSAVRPDPPAVAGSNENDVIWPDYESRYDYNQYVIAANPEDGDYEDMVYQPHRGTLVPADECPYHVLIASDLMVSPETYNRDYHEMLYIMDGEDNMRTGYVANNLAGSYRHRDTDFSPLDPSEVTEVKPALEVVAEGGANVSRPVQISSFDMGLNTEPETQYRDREFC